MNFLNQKGSASIMNAVLGAIVTIIGVLIVSSVYTAANLSGTESTIAGLLGLVLAAGGVIYTLMSVFRA